MTELKLFVWEGSGISDAYHDDGTLVVLAHDATEARRLMKEGRTEGQYGPTDGPGGWDGKLESIDREPDEVIELDGPKFVAFNGGGYD